MIITYLNKVDHADNLITFDSICFCMQDLTITQKAINFIVTLLAVLLFLELLEVHLFSLFI